MSFDEEDNTFALSTDGREGGRRNSQMGSGREGSARMKRDEKRRRLTVQGYGSVNKFTDARITRQNT